MPESKSDLSRAFSEDGALKTHVGGQALLEGIMMRGKLNWSAAIRLPDGNIYLEEHDLASGKDKNSWTRKPLIRGCTALVESLGLGFKALEVAASHAFNGEDYSYSVYLEEGKEALAKGEELTPEQSRVLAIQEGREHATYVYGEPDEADGAAGVAAATAEAEPAAPAASVPEGEARAAAGVAAATAEAEPAAGQTERFAEERFSWKRDFGNPDEMVDALGAQRTLEVVTDDEPAGNEADAQAALASLGAEPAPATKSAAKPAPESDGMGKVEMTISMVIGVALALALFIVAPATITNFVVGEYDVHPVLWNIFDGVLRVAIFVLYMWLIGRMKDIKRMFGYHGAEHKAIHCFEHGLPMTPENARKFPRLHVRCGTAFLIMVLIIAILVYTIIPVNLLITSLGVPEGLPKLLLVIATRIIFLPIIAGVSYEITVKWAGSHPDNALVKIILWPGMQMQYLTTNEPDDGQIECAIAAMQLVLEREKAAGL